MTNRLPLAFLAALALTGAAHAEAPPAGVQSGTYAIEPMHTEVLFKISHFGYSNLMYLAAGQLKAYLRENPNGAEAAQVKQTLARLASQSKTP